MSEKANFRKKLYLALSVLTFSATQVLLFTLFPFMAEVLSLSLSEIILCFSLGTLLFLWGAPYWSAKSDKIGRIKTINFGLLGLAISFGLIVFLLEFASLLDHSIVLGILIISRVIYGLLASSIVPVSQLARRDLVISEEHLSSMLSHSMALSLGRSIGPLLLLISQKQFHALLLCLTFWPVVLMIYAGKDVGEHIESQKLMAPSWGKSKSLLKLPLLVTILFTGYVGLLHSSLGNTLELNFKLTGIEAGQLMAQVLLLGSVVMTLVQLLAKMIFRQNFKITLYFGLALLSLGALKMAFIGQVKDLWTAITFICAGIALIQPGHLALVHALFPKGKLGREIGLLSSGNTIGYALGGALAALLLGPHIYKFALVLIGLLSIAIIKNTMRVRAC